MKKSAKNKVKNTKVKTKARPKKTATRAVKPAKKSTHSKEQEPRRRYFEHDGLRLHYWEWGDPQEETYVFVHGVRDQGRSWDHFLDELIGRGVPIKHAVALDLRGHGDSEWPSTSRGYAHEDFLTDLAGLLKHLDKEPVTIIGHSLGGSMCLLYAGTFPERVKRMVLVESLGPSGYEEGVRSVIRARFADRTWYRLSVVRAGDRSLRPVVTPY